MVRRADAAESCTTTSLHSALEPTARIICRMLFSIIPYQVRLSAGLRRLESLRSRQDISSIPSTVVSSGAALLADDLQDGQGPQQCGTIVRTLLSMSMSLPFITPWRVASYITASKLHYACGRPAWLTMLGTVCSPVPVSHADPRICQVLQAVFLAGKFAIDARNSFVFSIVPSHQ